MVYRQTENATQRLADKRARILAAARDLVADGGWTAAQVDHVAAKAGVATGTVYRHWSSKAELCAEIVATVSAREVGIVAAVADADGTPAEKLEAAIRTFASRALRGRRLAYALIAEPVDPEVETVRLDYRAQLARCFERVLREGIMRGAFPRARSCGGRGLHRRRLHGSAGRAARAGQGHRAARRPHAGRPDHPVLPARQHRRGGGQDMSATDLFARLPSLPPDGYATHEVMNQATPLVGHNAFTGDRLLVEIAGREKMGWAQACSPKPARRWRARASPGWRATPTATCRSCGATTASAIASTRSSSIPPGTS